MSEPAEGYAYFYIEAGPRKNQRLKVLRWGRKEIAPLHSQVEVEFDDGTRATVKRKTFRRAKLQ